MHIGYKLKALAFLVATLRQEISRSHMIKSEIQVNFENKSVSEVPWYVLCHMRRREIFISHRIFYKDYFETFPGNKETALFYAITSAGVTMEVTRACNMDRYFDECRCERTTGGKGKHLRWHGCNDNIKFGIEFSKAFLDAREQGNDARVLMNKQNNFAGRMVRLFITPIS